VQLNIRLIEGYAFGAIQPSAIITVKIDSAGNLKALEKILVEIAKALPEHRVEFKKIADHFDLSKIPEVRIFFDVLDRLNKFCGDQRFTPITTYNKDDSLVFVIPTLSPHMVKENIIALQKFSFGVSGHIDKSKLDDFVSNQKKQCRKYLPGGTNAGSFIEAAAERKIPFRLFNSKIIIFGYGSGSRIFNSSVTDEESFIGVTLAKSKFDTNRLLKISGFPVAEQFRVNSFDQASLLASKIGYPVVLKPEREEQGRGVHTHIADKDELSSVFDSLIKKYKILLLEKHVWGDGYRVYVLNEKVVRVRKLEAAHVIGDGEYNIKQLIDRENSAPSRNSISSSMKRIDIDSDTISLLKKQGMSLESIPNFGVKVVLSPTTNLSRGGSSVDFFNDLHPDNIDLCEQVSKTLHLRCSGVDLISVDASESWRSNGAVICEVNAQPQIGGSHRVDMHNDMVWGLVKKFPHITLNVCDDTNEDKYELYNASKSSLNITMGISSLLRSGCPTQYFNELHISDGLPEADREMVDMMLVSVMPEVDI
jgi:cyanophycin synthetase